MRIAFVTSSLTNQGGGVQAVVQHLSRELERSGLEVCVFGPWSSEAEQYVDKDWEGANVAMFKVTLPSPFLYSSELFTLLKDWKPDLVHVHGIWTATSVSILRWASESGRPYLISPHGMLDNWALKSSRLKKQLASLLYESRHLQNARCLHALCPAEYEAIRNVGLKSPVAIIPNGVHTVPESFSINSRSIVTEFARKRILVYLGRFHPKKNLESLLSAWAEIDEALKERWHLVMAGWGSEDYRQKLKIMKDEMLIADSVDFRDPLFGMEKDLFLREADAFVLPSLSEGLPMAVLEAWAYGLPVLMTAECNLPEGFESHAAFRLENKNGSLATDLESFLRQDLKTLKGVGLNGKRLVEANFSWDNVSNSFKETYAWMLGRVDAPQCLRI